MNIVVQFLAAAETTVKEGVPDEFHQAMMESLMEVADTPSFDSEEEPNFND